MMPVVFEMASTFKVVFRMANRPATFQSWPWSNWTFGFRMIHVDTRSCFDMVAEGKLLHFEGLPGCNVCDTWQTLDFQQRTPLFVLDIDHHVIINLLRFC